MYLSIIIPAYNEEDRIVTTLNHTISYLNSRDYLSEVLVISDGSTDRTKAVAENGFTSAEHVSLKAFEYHPNRGKGYAVRFGMLKGAGDRMMFMDADYSVHVEALEQGMCHLDNGADIAIASRAIDGSVVAAHQNLFRELSAKIYTFIQNRYLGIRYRDTQCGFKIFSARSARVLFQMQKLNSVIFDPEILWLAKQYDFNVAEFPVEWHHVDDSRIVYDNLQKSLFVFKELFRIKKCHQTT